MDYIQLIDAERLRFAKALTDAARRTGGRTADNFELVGIDQCLRFVCCDIGRETVLITLELPAAAWTDALEAELLRMFRGSAQLALRHLGRTAA